MKLIIPTRARWKSIKAEFEKTLTNFKREPEIRMFLTQHPWILSLAFGSGEGAVFSEYRIGAGENTDFLIVNGRSQHLRVTLVELKRPDARILNTKGQMDSAFSNAQGQTILRTNLIENDRQRFLAELKENLLMTADEKSQSPFQGVIHDNFFHVVRFNDLSKFTLTSKIIIGRRENETLAEMKFRNAVFDHKVEVMPYERLLNLFDDPPHLIEPEWGWVKI